MGGQSKVIATITRGTLQRGFTLRTCQLDEYGDFIYNPDGTESGLTYLYGTDPAENIALTWPEGRTRIFDAGTRGGQLRMGARQTAGVA